ncbi:MAG: substrate-binding domain-containing protein [Lachnospiraceae bacterium]|nr:substrate-binding domain-containing protein [Lachnospiraceae bacterium]
MTKKISRRDFLRGGAAVLALGTMEGAGFATTAQAEEKPTYTIATVRWTDSWPTDYLYEGIMQELADKHGINIEWQVYYNSDWSEQKSLLLASGDLPDAFFGSICLTATDVSQNKPFFVELTDLIDEYMPNLVSVMEECPDLRAVCTDRDGKIYSLPKKLPLRPKVCGNVLYINQDWLDNLGLEMPTTLDELTAVLKAFAAEDADGDGDATSEIGYTNAAGSVFSGDLRNIMFPFGTMVSRADNYMGLNGEGTPVFMPIEENYKSAVAWMHDLYESGVLDPEYFTQEGSTATAKRQAEGGSKVGLFTGWTADAEAGVNASQFVALEAIEGPDGNRYVENASNYLDISDRELLITTKCENPEKLLAWADDFYTDLVSLQTYYGSIPDCVAENEDGTYEVLVPEDGSSLDTSAWSNSMRDFGPKYMTDEFAALVSLPEDQGDGIKLAEDEINAQYVTTDRNVGLPVLQYTDDELSRINTLGIDIYSYCEAQYAHWVVDGGVEEEWDSYVEQLKKMGVEELISIHQDAYDAYLENKEA